MERKERKPDQNLQLSLQVIKSSARNAEWTKRKQLGPCLLAITNSSTIQEN